MPANLRPLRRAFATAVVISLGAVASFAQSAATPASSDKADAFFEAARKGDAATVRRLLDEGVDVNTKFRYGATALSYACDRANLDVVKLLLERGADVNVQDTFYHSTPLGWATSPQMGRKPQHAEIVGLLLKRGAKGGEVALMASINANDAAMVKAVLDNGAPSAAALTNGLESATRGGKRDIVAMLEQAGAKPFVEFKIDEPTLARYAGTYHSDAGVDMVLAAADGRLAGTAFGQRISLTARDQTTFRVSEFPGATITFRVEGDSVTSATLNNSGNTLVLTRVAGK